MMYEIKMEFDDQCMPNGKSRFFANTDKVISPYNRELYPIKFTGYLNGEKIEFILINSDSKDIQNYKFEIFPSTYEYIKKEIPFLIDDYLNDSMK